MRCGFLALCSLLAASATTSLPAGFSVLDPKSYQGHLQSDLQWCTNNVPFIDLEDPDILTAYYYRWRSYKKHITQTPDGWVITEFLPKVSWAGKDDTIPAGTVNQRQAANMRGE